MDSAVENFLALPSISVFPSNCFHEVICCNQQEKLQIFRHEQNQDANS